MSDLWQTIDVACAVSENVYAVNEAFFAFDLFTILPSLQVIHCGKNTVQGNEIYSDSNKCYRNTRESHCEPWNRVKCFSVQFGGSVLISKSSFADKSTVPYWSLLIKWYMLSNLLRYFEENNLKRDNSSVLTIYFYTEPNFE